MFFVPLKILSLFNNFKRFKLLFERFLETMQRIAGFNRL